MRSTILCLLIWLAGVCSPVAQAQTLGEELYRMDQLRAFDKTPFDEVERMANQLLQQYLKPEEQAAIYYAVAEVYAQSGQVKPAKTAEFCKKALDLPSEPTKRLQLYVYWGDSIQVANAGSVGERMAAARREAAVPYLTGLMEASAQALPAEPPDLPGVGKFDAAPDDPQYEALRRRHQQQLQARRLAEAQRIVMRHRDTLTDQIAHLYSRLPHAPEELEKLASKMLGNKVEVERLMAVTRAQMRKRLAELKPESTGLPKDLDASPVPAPSRSPRAPTKPDQHPPASADDAMQPHPTKSLASEASGSGHPVAIASITAVVAVVLALGVFLARHRARRPRATAAD